MINWIKKHYWFSTITFLLVAWFSFISLGASSGKCNKCTQLSAQAVHITLEELSACPQKYENKLVRLYAILHHDSGELFLGNGGAKFSSRVIAGIGKDYTSCYFTRRAFTFNTGYRTWYDGSAKVTLIGKFGIIDNQLDFHDGMDGLTILCFEAVNPHASWTVPINHIRYVITRTSRMLLRLNFEP